MSLIQNSIDKYYDSVMNDMNSSARIIVEDKTVKTYITRIIDWNDNNITFHAPLVLGDYVRLIHGHIYPFVIVTKACIYTTSLKIDKFAKNKQGHFYYSATIASPLERNQQRMYFRLDWVVPFKFKLGRSNDWHEASTLDLSAGGLKMATSEHISRNESIHIHINLYNTDIFLNGVVLDEIGKNHADLYVYRVQFHEISKGTENLLAQFIMQKQREMLRRT